MRAQGRLKDLRLKEEEQDEKIRTLKSELHRARERSLGTSIDVDVGILIDSEDNLQWLKKRAAEIIESLSSLKQGVHAVRCGVVYYNPQRAGISEIRVLPFTDDFQRLSQELPSISRDPSTLAQVRTGFRGAIGETLNLLQWQGTARLLLHPSPSSVIQKGQDPPTGQNTNFFTRFGGSGEDMNIELQRSILAMRALYIDYFIVKTGKADPAENQKRGDAKFSVAISRYFDDPDSFLECRFMKVEETHNIKKAILSCVGMAMRS